MIDEQHARDLINDQIESRVEPIKKAMVALQTQVTKIEAENEKRDAQVTRLSLVTFGDADMKVPGLLTQMVSIRKLMYTTIVLLALNLVDGLPEWWPTLLKYLS